MVGTVEPLYKDKTEMWSQLYIRKTTIKHGHFTYQDTSGCPKGFLNGEVPLYIHVHDMMQVYNKIALAIHSYRIGWLLDLVL